MLCNVIENGKNRCFDYLNQGDLYENVEYVSGEQKAMAGVEVRRIKVRKTKYVENAKE